MEEGEDFKKLNLNRKKSLLLGTISNYGKNKELVLT